MIKVDLSKISKTQFVHRGTHFCEIEDCVILWSTGVLVPVILQHGGSTTRKKTVGIEMGGSVAVGEMEDGGSIYMVAESVIQTW